MHRMFLDVVQSAKLHFGKLSKNMLFIARIALKVLLPPNGSASLILLFHPRLLSSPRGLRLPTYFCDDALAQTQWEIKNWSSASGRFTFSSAYSQRGGSDSVRGGHHRCHRQREGLRKHFWWGFRGVTPRGRVCGKRDVRTGEMCKEGGSSVEVERIPLVDAS